MVLVSVCVAAWAASVCAKRPEFVMYDKLYAAPGVECNVYFASALDSVRPEIYAFEVRARVGQCENERWTWTPKPEDAGRRESIVLNAWSDEGLACSRTVTVHVASAKANPSRRVTCALLGDSLTNSRYQDRILNVVREAGWSGYTPVGSRSGYSAEKVGVKREGEAAHDGYGGYTPNAFLTQYKLSVEELDNIQSEQEREQLKGFGVKLGPGPGWRKDLLKSPLVRIRDGKKVVDVQGWFDRINGGAPPDYILIYLGVNGTCGQRDANLAEYCEKSQVAPMRDLVKTLRTAAPAARICLGTCAIGTDQDAFGKGYGCSISAVQCHKNMHYLNKCWMALVKEFNDAGDVNVFIVPVGHAIDPIRGYPAQEVKPFVHSNEKIMRKNNAVHPTQEGGKQLGDAFAAWLLYNLSELDVHEEAVDGGAVRWFEEMVPMPDGTALYTYGSAPAKGVKCPIVVRRTPYVAEKRVEVAKWAKQQKDALARGYAYVVQHCRGCGMSEGNWVPYESERTDGLALLEYIRKLPWYNGEIFLEGGSYLASVHWSYLDTNPSDVKGAFLTVQEVDRYNVCYRNGFFKAGLHGGWYLKCYWKKDKSLQRDNSVTFAQFPLCEFSRRYWGRPEPVFDNVVAHPVRSDPYWQSVQPGSGVQYRNALLKSTMPILLKTGFYDIYTEGVCDMWREVPAGRRANCALIIDAYDHSGRPNAKMAGTPGEFPGGSRADEHVEALDWFDSIRKGRPCEGAGRGRTRYYALWENEWHDELSLEDGPRTMRFALGAGARTYTYDPKRPLPEFPGSGGICFGGMQVQPEPDFRDDVASFVLQPVEERIDVRGRMSLELEVASDCEDTCFYARVDVQKGDGRWYLLRDDIVSLCLDGRRYEPGTRTRVAFRFADHAFRLEKGDRLRIDVSSGNSHFAPHGNVKGLQSMVREPKVARNTVFAEGSTLTLHALPR